MAYSSRTYTPGSSTTTFALTTSGGDPIGYIRESDIVVKVNGTTFTNAASGSNTYQFSGTSTVEQPSGGSIVLNAGVTGTVILERTTAIQNATVTYTAGSTLTADDLNNADNQIRFGLQEFSDDYSALFTGTGNLTTLGAFLGSSDTWASNDAKAATTGAIDGRVDSKIDTALTTDVSGGDGVTIVDNSPGAGQIRVDLDTDIATLRNMQTGAATALAALTSTEVAILDGATLTTTELNYVDGVTSAVQTQLDAKQPLDGDLTTLSSALAAADLAALTSAEVQILDGATVTTAELNVLDGIPATLTAGELGYVDGVSSSIQTQLNAKQPLNASLTAITNLSDADGQFIVGSPSGWVAESLSTARASLGAQAAAADLTNLSSCQTGASAALALLTSTEVAILDGATPSTTELNYVDGVTSAIQAQIDGKQPLDSELTTLAGMQGATASVLAAGTSLAATIAEINSVCENRAGQTTITDDDAKIPTSGAVVDYVTGAVTAVGGFKSIVGPTNFPSTQPDQGVVVSISDVGSGFTTSSNEITITNGAGTGNNVRITGFPSSLAATTIADDVGLQVTSDKNNSTSGSPNVHRYVYHKILAKETDVIQLSDDINDFNERYRVSNGAPSGTDHAGDLYYDTGSDKMLVRNAANNAWEEVQSIGNFYISTLSPAFNGSLEDFTVSNAPSNAQQLLISINGVIQKPNSGTSRPSEGFALNGSTVLFSDPPPNGADYFVVVIGSEVNIGAPSNNTVGNNQLMSGAVDNAKVAANAAIDYSKLAALTDGNILVGNGSNVATSVNPSGDIDISNAGVFSIASGAIVNADVNASAAIALSKLAITGTGSNSNFLRGDGSWQSVPAGISLSGSTDNTIATVTGANALQGEANLTFDGHHLTQTIDANAEGFNQTAAGNHYIDNTAEANLSSGDNPILRTTATWNGKMVAMIKYNAGTDTTNKDDGYITFNTSAANDLSERVRIDSSGRLLVNQTTGSSNLCVSDTNPVIAEFYHSDGGTNDQARISLGAYSSNPPSQRGVNLVGENNGAGHDFVVQCSPSHSLGPTEALRVHSNGDITVPSGSIKLAATQGINFYNYGSGTDIDSNLLDDYEEGEFDCKFVTNSGTFPTQSVIGHYIKIGKVVSIHCQITFGVSAGSGGGMAWVELPFTVANCRGGVSIGLVSGCVWSANHQLFMIPELSSYACYLVETEPNASGHSHIGPASFNNTASNLFSFGGTYITA